ncbi:Nif3-like dinuclear metal center hexameric protein [Blautia sp. RD014234]|nr:Nif3-like dinuclear metal center hexameric protein [Blautia parvula]
MKNEEVIDRILQFHPDIPDYDGCDGYKSGNPSDECTGVVSALVPTVDVIRKTAELGCNLLVTHEPIYYQTPDYPEWKGEFENRVYDEKKLCWSVMGSPCGGITTISMPTSRI